MKVIIGVIGTTDQLKPITIVGNVRTAFTGHVVVSLDQPRVVPRASVSSTKTLTFVTRTTIADVLSDEGYRLGGKIRSRRLDCYGYLSYGTS